MPIINYDSLIKVFLKEAKDEAAIKDLLDANDYLKLGFAKELAIANRDYDLGLSDSKNIRGVQVKAYHAENKIRRYLGLEPLPPMNESIL